MRERRFVRSLRQGGYTFVTAPDYPGFNFMLTPGEDDTELNEAFDFFADYVDKHEASAEKTIGYVNVKREVSVEKPILDKLWRDDPATPEGKYLVMRRDGTVVEWPSFVLGAKDPAAPAALRAYCDAALAAGINAGYVSAVRRLADEFDAYRKEHGPGDADRGRHRVDDPETVAKMRQGRSV